MTGLSPRLHKFSSPILQNTLPFSYTRHTSQKCRIFWVSSETNKLTLPLYNAPSYINFSLLSSAQTPNETFINDDVFILLRTFLYVLAQSKTKNKEVMCMGSFYLDEITKKRIKSIAEKMGTKSQIDVIRMLLKFWEEHHNV